MNIFQTLCFFTTILGAILGFSKGFSTDTLLVTVSDDRSGRKGGLYQQTQEKVVALFANNPQFGITKFSTWTWKDIIKTSFYEKNKILLDNAPAYKNGYAYKPFVILEALKTLKDGEYLIYSDVSPETWQSFNRDSKISPKYHVDVLKNLCNKNNGILTTFVSYDHTHAKYTLERCLKRMGLEMHRNSLQHASGIWVIRKSPFTQSFVEEWLYWNTIDECACLGYANIPDDTTFWQEEYKNKEGHRHDQSISGLLINKIGNKLVQIPDDYQSTGLHHNNFLQLARIGVTYNFVESVKSVKRKRQTRHSKDIAK